MCSVRERNVFYPKQLYKSLDGESFHLKSSSKLSGFSSTGNIHYEYSSEVCLMLGIAIYYNLVSIYLFCLLLLIIILCSRTFLIAISFH